MFQTDFSMDTYKHSIKTNSDPTYTAEKMFRLQKPTRDIPRYRPKYTSKPVIMALLYLGCAFTLLSVVENKKLSLHCEEENVLWANEPIIWNMRKEDLRLPFLHEFKLGNNASQTTANINRAWGEGITSDRTVRRWFQKFRSGDESLKDEESRGRSSNLDNENLRAIVEQNPRQSVREMSRELGVSSSRVSDHLKQIGWTLLTPSRRCYKYFDDGLSWQDARSTCISYAAVLVEPVGYEVNLELAKLIRNSSSSANHVWIGYNYINDQTNNISIRTGYWSDRSRISIQIGFWDINQPSLNSGQCAEITYTSEDQWKWRLSPCENRKPYICQRTACPEGTFYCGVSGKHSACLNKTKVCDGVPDCPNGSDETKCPERNHFYIKNDAGEINFTNPVSGTNCANGTTYQWIIEGRTGTRLQLTIAATDSLNALSVLEVWLTGRTLQDSYRYATFSDTLTLDETVISNNNLALIRWAVYKRDPQKTLNITWKSDPSCYWKHVSNRTDPNAASINTIDLKPSDNIKVCLDACNSTCNIVVVDKIEKKCQFYELVPLVISSSCCESYVKICPPPKGVVQDLLARKVFQVFHSSTYPLEYSENTHHTWILKAPPREIITLQFLDVDLDPQAAIIVYDGGNSGNKVLAKLVNVSMRITLFSTGNILTIHFRTGPKAVIRRGFLARYKSGCDLIIKSDFVQIQSPGYDISTPYPPRLNCTWQIHSKTEPPALTLKFDVVFSLEKDKDFLKVYNGTIENKFVMFNGEGFTGNTPPPILHSYSGHFTLRFTTNAITSDVGFRATFSSVTYCGPVPNLVHGYWEKVSGFYSGHNATYKCLENYNTTTANTIYCSKQGHWEPQPKCEVKTCPTPVNLDYGVWEKEGYAFRLVCHEHARLIGYPIVFCWNGTLQGNATCKRIPYEYCKPKYVAMISPENRTLYKGESINVTCQNGHRLLGNNPFVCGVQPTPICEDINECKENTSSCDQICINTQSSYECECYPGYKKKNSSSNKSDCIDVDECKINNGDCSHICKNLPGSYECSCPPGWYLFKINGQQNITVLPGDTGHDPGDYYRYNHTCFKTICEQPDIKHGYLVSGNNKFYCNDSVRVLCNEGFVLIGASNVTCLQNGNWTAFPTCKRGRCRAVTSKAGVVDPSGESDYGQNITIKCTYNGTTVIKYRTCVWDLKNKTFRTVGDSPECPVIDCGIPEKISGALAYQYNNCTTVNCSFEFKCLSGFNQTGTGSGPNNISVICGTNGRWHFYDLACVGLSCKDPGRPADGQQVGDSYEEGSLIRFRCLRPGFVPEYPYPLQCLYNGSLHWNGTVPRCVDREKPRFLKCPKQNLYVKRMSSIHLPVLKAVDNSGEFLKVEVVPDIFRFSQVVLTDVNITYIARDSAKNSASCSFQLKLNGSQDTDKPKLVCPNITTYLLDGTTTLTEANFSVNASDDSGHVNLTYEPNSLELGQRPGDYIIKVTATDPSNNTEICYIQVKTENYPNTLCESRRLFIPNSKISCQKSSTGNVSWNVSCINGYWFFDAPERTIRILQSNNSKGWETEGIFCTAEQKSAYVIVFVYTYRTKNETCVQNALEPQITKMQEVHNEYLKTTMAYPVKIGKPTVGYLEILSTQAFADYVNATVRLEISSKEYKVHNLEMIANDMIDFYAKAGAQQFSVPCGATGSVEVTYNDYLCKSAAKKFVINEKGLCVSCPPGTYGKDFYKCIPCPENTYNAESNRTQCTDCPPGTYVNTTGSTTVNSCYSKCPPGFYSSTGYIPCSPCPEQTYAYNSTLCKVCPPGTKTAGRGASSESDCKFECLPGNYSLTGFQPCTLCPPNTFAEFNAAKICEPCPEMRYLNANVSTNRTECKKNLVCLEGVCQNGATCFAGHNDYYCDCLNGFKGKNCSEIIDPCQSNPCFHNQTCTQIGSTQDYNCTCENGYFGLHCEFENSTCETNNTCQNHGICRNVPGSYECLCPSWSGYTGPRCEKESNPCQPDKCKNNATCVPTGKIRSHCVCSAGFTGKYCEENINECSSEPCLNGGTCIDGVTNFTCQCAQGFHGKLCHVPDEPCKNVNCGTNMVCINNYFNNTHYCVCVKDFILNPQYPNACMAVNNCDDRPCKNNGKCRPDTKPFRCMCQPGFEGSTCHKRNESTNSSSCQSGEELRKIGQIYQCVCKTPLIGGVRCIERIDYCKYNECKEEGTHNCINQEYDYTCNCSEGFSGRYCQVKPCDLRCINGKCVSQNDNWICKCEDAWKGENCSELINACDSNPCENQGECFGTLHQFHCRCPPGFRNKTCNTKIDFCASADHCVGNGSKCLNEATHATCECAQGYGGIGCQNRSPCTPTTCENSGTCQVQGNKAKCICPVGFGGERCNITLNQCDTLKGCASDCEIQGQRAFCKCAAGRIGKYCKQDVVYDVDFLFPRTKGFIRPTPMPMWSQLTRNFLSLSFWIKHDLPYSKDESTTSVVLYGTDKPDGKSQITELLSFDKDRLIIKFAEIENFTLPGLVDGRWHQVFLNWTDSNISVYVDSKIVINEEYGKDRTLPEYGVIVPAGKIDTSGTRVMPSNFAGRISRLVLLKSTLTQEKVKSIWNDVSEVLPDVHLDFYRNLLEMANILLVFPSEICQEMCELNPNCTSSDRNHFPTVEMCPQAQMKVASRWAKLDWLQPKFSNHTITVSNYISGESYFSWGAHTIEYIAFGKKNQTASVCTFQLFSRRFSCEETIPLSYLNDTERGCLSLNESIVCIPSCHESNKRPAIAGPRVYSCGKYHMWGRENTSYFRIPPCTNVTNVGKVTAKIKMTMNFDGAQPLSSMLCSEIQIRFSIFIKLYMLCTGENCFSCSWKSNDTSRRKRAIYNPPVEIDLTNINSYSPNGTSAQDILLNEIINKNKLYYQSLNASVLPDTVTISLYCPTGQVLSGQTCVKLQSVPGTFLNNKTNAIEVCPKGTYQPDYTQTSCITCPLRKTTKGEMSTSADECKEICIVGSYFSSKESQCIPCDIGFYQSKNSSFFCEGCDAGEITEHKGSASRNDCITPEKSTPFIPLRTLSANTTAQTAAVAKAGLSARDIAIIVVVTLLILFFLMCIILFCCRTKIKEVFPCLTKNKVEDAPELKERYSKGNVKMVSYNLSNIRERRMGAGNNPKPYTERNDYQDNYDNASDLSSSLEGIMHDGRPLTKRRVNERNPIKENLNGTGINWNADIPNGDALLQLHQQPRIGAKSESGELLVKVKPKRPKNNVVKVHLSNFPRKEPKIMIDSDEEDVR